MIVYTACNPLYFLWAQFSLKEPPNLLYYYNLDCKKSENMKIRQLPDQNQARPYWSGQVEFFRAGRAALMDFPRAQGKSPGASLPAWRKRRPSRLKFRLSFSKSGKAGVPYLLCKKSNKSSSSKYDDLAGIKTKPLTFEGLLLSKQAPPSSTRLSLPRRGRRNKKSFYLITGGKTCQCCGYKHIYDYIHQNMPILWPLHLEQVTSQTDGRVLSARVQQTTPGIMEGELYFFLVRLEG